MKNNPMSAVTAEGISKSFRLPHEQYSGLKQFLLNIFRRPSQRVYGYETQHVLDDISFEIKKGEFFGIVGRNGSGKSTLLKLLANIYTPDQGAIHINGSLTPFIELGVGFNPELTGRENVYLNGALLGFSHKQMDAMYDDIVSFAELERFMDQKLKNYSSGMQVRLAFSIAIRAQSDILLIDEVLAVGDEKFQEKCFDYFETLRQNPEKTVIIVTHDMAAIERYCTRVLVVNNGKNIYCGKTEDAINVYHNLNTENITSRVDYYQAKYLRSIHVYNQDSPRIPSGEEQTHISRGAPIVVELSLMGDPKIGGVGVAIFSVDGSYCYGTNTFIDKAYRNKSIPDSMCLTITNPDILQPGEYYCKVGIFGSRDTKVLEFFDNKTPFIIDGKRVRHGVAELETIWR